MKLKFRIWLENEEDELVIGQGLFTLLNLIKSTGSINKSAKALNMSYRTAWGKIKKAEIRYGCELVKKKSGGKSGGGTTLTKGGEQLLTNFDNLNQEAEKYMETLFNQYL
ncbi:LysR family transcriptional regulator [Proteinivorax tanatarense]|uniref:LysR family transcriptional regulator n=1 Tax=Proteinivorax tanatarense TaxID=1260629 RepID=A0AAU7VK88_9FIRM